MDGVISRAGLICSGLYPYWVTTCWFTRRGKKKKQKTKSERERRGCGYWHSGGGEGDGERELLTLSKLANPSASRALRRGGEEGAKGSAKGSFAGREEEEEEEEKSPEVCGMKFPRRWKESEDSVRLMDDFLPDRAQTGRLSKGRFYFMNTVGTSPDVW